MKAVALIILVVFSIHTSVFSQTILATGEQPQMAVDLNGTVRLVYGENERIFYAESTDNGSTFSKPIVVAEVPGMHLGMTRGPQIASSKEYSLITAMNKEGNIVAFVMNHKTRKWETAGRVNDSKGSAPEGLMSIAADDNNRFYAVWLDLRNNKKNNICFASFENKKWSVNKFAYVSTEDHVCECCKPSVYAKGNTVSIMFRNWLRGSRDLYITTSTDRGATFSQAQKLGNGTWQLKGCPMDGGGLAIDSKNQIHTAWQRDGMVYFADPGQPEEKIGDGRHVSLSGNIVAWQNGPNLIIKEINNNPQTIGEGNALSVLQLNDRSILCAWEKDNQIVVKKVKKG